MSLKRYIPTIIITLVIAELIFFGYPIFAMIVLVASFSTIKKLVKNAPVDDQTDGLTTDEMAEVIAVFNTCYSNVLAVFDQVVSDDLTEWFKSQHNGGPIYLIPKKINAISLIWDTAPDTSNEQLSNAMHLLSYKFFTMINNRSEFRKRLYVSLAHGLAMCEDHSVVPEWLKERSPKFNDSGYSKEGSTSGKLSLPEFLSENKLLTLVLIHRLTLANNAANSERK